MSEQSDVVGALEAAGVLGGIRWAFRSASARVFDDYSEANGHNPTWVGVTRYALFCDRLDRVFACERYAVQDGSDAGVSLDLLHAELTKRDVETMPQLAPDLVVRDGLSGSPGWAFGQWRWLLASGQYGKLNEIPWSQKSPTKQRVARQPDPDPDQASLFESLTDAESVEWMRTIAEVHRLDRTTLVVAHAQDIDDDGRELIIGRPRLNTREDEAWHWRHGLLDVPPVEEPTLAADPRGIAGPEVVPDAPVTLRPRTADKSQREDGGR